MERNLLDEVIASEYLDVGHYDATIKFPDGYGGASREFIISRISNADIFLMKDGNMRTPEITINAYVTKKQDALLRALYVNTVHPSYIDQRYPITLIWGSNSISPQISNMPMEDGKIANGLPDTVNGMFSADFYLASYTSLVDADFGQAALQSVSLVLRLI